MKFKNIAFDERILEGVDKLGNPYKVKALKNKKFFKYEILIPIDCKISVEERGLFGKLKYVKLENSDQTKLSSTEFSLFVPQQHERDLAIERLKEIAANAKAIELWCRNGRLYNIWYEYNLILKDNSNNQSLDNSTINYLELCDGDYPYSEFLLKEKY